MNIELIKAVRQNLTKVRVKYSINGKNFNIFWIKNEEHGKFYLDVNVSSLDVDISSRISKCIKIGESYDNKDYELYLFLTSTFSSDDCKKLKTKLKNI